MKYLLALLLIVPAYAQAPAEQQAAKPEEKAAQAPAKPEEKPAAEAQKTEQPAAENPAPATEQNFTGSIDFGYRFRTDIRGSVPTYRSIVNLGEGPRLFGTEFTIRDPKHRLFDTLNANGYNWGDPYNTAHVDATKRGIYNFRFDYRNILYYNALPSYANPFAPAGWDEQARDVRRRLASFDLELLPGKHIVPYLAYDRNSGEGNGITTWVQGTNNEYPVGTNFHDGTSNYRGGVRFEFSRFHVTLEQGGTTFREDDSVYQTSLIGGDRTAPVLGQTLQLANLQQAYGIRGNAIYSKAYVTANPFSWLNLYGQFLYSEPKTDVNYSDAANGNFLLLSSLLFYTGQGDAVTGSANKPHISGNAGFEMRPFRRFRIAESWLTDRYHDAAYSLIAEQLLFNPTSQLSNTVTPLPDRQVVNYNRTQTDLFFDVTKKITLRGGYRYEWGDASVRSGPLNPIQPFESGSLNRQVGIAGLNVRPIQKLSLNGEYEGASTTHAYFRTSLYDYNRVRARGRYQFSDTLSAQANFTYMNNWNPTPGVNYEFESRDNALSLTWTPKGSKRVSVLAEYDRATFSSNINYLIPPFLTPGINSYRDSMHLATAAIDLGLPGWKAGTPKLTVGGSLAVNNGSRTSRYYQPLMRLSVPLQKHVYWNTEWQWYGFNEDLFLYEAFRVHTVQTGLRLTR
ncbi:MAG: hypothetical protein LAQ30_03995 [Acidobacteriia bacterium]|nr:hypothetical protein [Terriglobia bacterium]